MNASFRLRLPAECKFLGLALLLGLYGFIAGCGGSSDNPTLTSISVAPPTLSLAAGLTTQFAATGVYSDGTKKDISASVTWASTTAGVATISSAGLAQAVAAGSTSITATSGTIVGTITLTVTPATLVSIDVTPATPSIALGTSQQFAATGTYTDNTTQALTSMVTWSSAQSGVAAVSSAGLATSASAGTTSITAALGNVTGATTLTITPAALLSIAVTPTNATLAKGVTEAVVATGTYTDNSTQNLTGTVTWTSSNTAVATLGTSAGGEIATAVAPGTATITAALGSVSGQTGLTVTGATLVSIDVAPPNPGVGVGATQQFTATGVYTDNSTQTITSQVIWSSSNVAVATVSNAATFDGLATTLETGTTTITATLGGVTASTTLTVNAATLVSIGVTPANPSVAKGSPPQQFVAMGVYSDASTRVLTTTATWKSSNGAVATISNAAGSNGSATLVAAGTTSVTATVGNITSTAVTLTVTPATLLSIAVTPNAPTVAKGTPEQFTATGSYSDGTTQNITGSATWTSTTPATATISNAAGSNGLASTLATGTTSIKAAVGTVSSTGSTLTVTPATLESIAVTPAAAGIAKGTTQQFTATGTYTDQSMQVLTTTATWTSGTPATATISNTSPNKGKASAVAVGTTVITAASGGITSPGVTLTVTPAALQSIAVTPANRHVFKGNEQQFTATGTYTDNTTQSLTTAATWSSGTQATATISNAPGSNGLATALANGTTSITATSGAVVSPAVTLTVSAAEYAYVCNFFDGTISQYTVGPDGGLVPMTMPIVGTGLNPYAFAIDPTHHFLYVVNNDGAPTNPLDGNSVTQFSIGADGALTAILPNVATGNTPNGITVDATATHAYVANYGDGTHLGSVSQYSIDTTTGVLSPLGTPTVAAGVGAASVTINAAGNVAYVMNYGSTDHSIPGSIGVYAIAGDGSLSQTSSVTYTGTSAPDYMVIDASARYAYVSSPVPTPGKVYEFSIAAVGGALTPLSTQYVGLAGDAHSLTLGPAATTVYAPQFSADSVAEYTVGNNGLLSLLHTTSVATGSGPNKFAVDPSGQYAYTANRSNGTVSQFSVAADGKLTLLATPTVVSGAETYSNPTWILVTTGY